MRDSPPLFVEKIPRSDAPRPAQDMVVEITELADTIYGEGCIQDGSRDTKERRLTTRSPTPLPKTRGYGSYNKLATERIGASFLNRGSFLLPKPGSKPLIREALAEDLQTQAGRFYRLPSGHAMIGSPFEGKWKWVSSD